MVDANCLIFPAPKFRSARSIDKHIVYIPRSIHLKHFYPSEQAIDYLNSSNASTSRSFRQKKSSPHKFKIIKMLRKNKRDIASYIPCVFLKGSYHEDKLIFYFHSNAQDIVSAFSFAEAINSYSGRSVIMIQYPGYSIYKQSNSKLISQNGKNKGQLFESTAQNIQSDSIKVFQYMKQVVGFRQSDVTLLGRSIGSGPAVYLSSIYKVGSLILLSPFLSICEAVKDLYGGLCSNLIKQRFNNKQRAKQIKSPTLIIHGLKDTLIHYRHSVELSKEIRNFSVIKLIQQMKHNSFHFHKQFLVHVKDFLRKIESELY